ncbi:Carboxypeptidase B [Papilio machaon]|uniref:Carboxypeptidase B n=1 Tax=Papilio machaon TaxID=76193 RepID=A0A194RRM6_PAPMA|nr:Carboxypeptidase B [Papilio machaon]
MKVLTAGAIHSLPWIPASIQTAINICSENKDDVDVTVEGTRVMQLERLLRNRNIVYEVTETNADAMGRLRFASPTPSTYSPKSPRKSGRRLNGSPDGRGMDWTDYHPLNVIYKYLVDLEAQCPSTCTLSVIGTSVEGRDIMLLKISNSNASNTGVWLDGTIHAREWISASVVLYIGEQLAKNFDSMPTSITNKDWYLVPIVNPDGYVYTHTSDRMWRKNRARLGSTVVGVDLNRNFGVRWGVSGTEFSSGDPNHNNFRGPSAFSEPEAGAIKDFILYSSIPFKIFLTFHSYSEVITFPWCFTTDPCPDYVYLLEGATVMSKAIYDTSGRLYKVGNFRDLMYPASGTSIDWSYGIARIPYSYLVELRSKEHKFALPKKQIIECCEEIWNGVKALAEHVDKKKCLNCEPLKHKDMQ